MFDQHFHEFSTLEPQFVTPSAANADSISVDLQIEIVDLLSDTILKQKYMDVGMSDFCKFVSRERFLKLVNAAARITAMFNTMYYMCVNSSSCQ